MSVRNPRAATKAARNKIDNSALSFILGIAVTHGHPTLVQNIERHLHNRDLLNARLERERKPFTVRFRIHWWNVIAVLGASALFVWLIVHVFTVWSS